jgi:uncharacterized membrane protein YhfC
MIAGLLQALCMTCGPLALAMLLRRRWKVPWRLFGIGLFAFTVSKVIQVPLQMWTKGKIVQLAAPLQFGIMLLFAPLCEELARYAAFRWFAKNARSFRESVFVGIGHGGFEAIFFGVLVGINVVGATQIPAEAANALLAQKLLNAPTGIRVLAVLERAEAMTFHCAASWLVMRVFVTGKMRYLLYAMGLHLLLNGILIGAAPRLGLTGMIALGLLVGLVPLVILLVAGKARPDRAGKGFRRRTEARSLDGHFLPKLVTLLWRSRCV